MSNFTSVSKEKILEAKREQAEYVWMHDSWANPTLTPNFDILWMPNTILDWGMNDADVTYVPYWRDGGAKSGDPDLFVSVWKMNGRVLLGVFNYNRKDTKDVTLKLDFKKLGLGSVADRLFAVDLYSQPKSAPIVFDAEGCTLAFKGLVPHAGRFIGIRETDPAPVALAREQCSMMVSECGLAPMSLPESVVDMGLITSKTLYSAPGKAAWVKTESGVKVATWRLSDRVLFAVINDSGTAKDADVRLDLDKLGLRPQREWQDFIRVRDLNKGTTDPDSVLDYYGSALQVKSIQPKSVRLVAVRRY
jgi:hypothetical protein